MRCISCMKEINSEICPFCNKKQVMETVEKRHLAPRTILFNRYELGCVLEANSIFVTYNAFDEEKNEKVFIDEFLPISICKREKNKLEVVFEEHNKNKYLSGLNAFIDECSDLLEIEHTDIIAGFEENNTFYVVRRVVEGVSFAEIIDGDYDINESYVKKLISSTLKALEPIHNLGIIHGNLTPETIFIDSRNNKIVFTSFSFCGYMSRIIPVYTNEGYSPLEQYKRGEKLTTKVDIYSLGAIFYEMTTNIIPITAVARSENDTLRDFRYVDISKNIGDAIMKALAIDEKNRTSSVKEFYEEINLKVKESPKKKSISKEDVQKGKNKDFWFYAFIYGVIAIVVISVVVVAVEFLFAKKDVDDKKKIEEEISTEAIPDTNKSIFEIFGTEEETETTSEEETESIPKDDVESGSGILSIIR